MLSSSARTDAWTRKPGPSSSLCSPTAAKLRATKLNAQRPVRYSCSSTLPVFPLRYSRWGKGDRLASRFGSGVVFASESASESAPDVSGEEAKDASKEEKTVLDDWGADATSQDWNGSEIKEKDKSGAFAGLLSLMILVGGTVLGARAVAAYRTSHPLDSRPPPPPPSTFAERPAEQAPASKKAQATATAEPVETVMPVETVEPVKPVEPVEIVSEIAEVGTEAAGVTETPPSVVDNNRGGVTDDISTPLLLPLLDNQENAESAAETHAVQDTKPESDTVTAVETGVPSSTPDSNPTEDTTRTEDSSRQETEIPESSQELTPVDTVAEALPDRPPEGSLAEPVPAVKPLTEEEMAVLSSELSITALRNRAMLAARAATAASDAAQRASAFSSAAASSASAASVAAERAAAAASAAQVALEDFAQDAILEAEAKARKAADMAGEAESRAAGASAMSAAYQDHAQSHADVAQDASRFKDVKEHSVMGDLHQKWLSIWARVSNNAHDTATKIMEWFAQVWWWIKERAMIIVLYLQRLFDKISWPFKR